jgi:hypothetical protein
VTNPSDQQVLEERARKLARPVDVQQPGETIELVTFVLAGETYGVEANRAMIDELIDHALRQKILRKRPEVEALFL